MSSRSQRRWPWFQQFVDLAIRVLGVVVAATMLVRDSWPIAGVVFSLLCLGLIGSEAAINMLLQRWGGGSK